MPLCRMLLLPAFQSLHKFWGEEATGGIQNLFCYWQGHKVPEVPQLYH